MAEPNSAQGETDRRFMAMALGLAERGLGRVWPNPAVGCVLVRPDATGNGAGVVVGRGWTQPGGRPHAETEALGRAAWEAPGTTAYVSLEPCSHHGATPPCAEALIDAAVARVVVALEDPDPRVSGRGIARLRQAGVTVDVGVLAEPAAALNAGFLCRVTQGRPWFILKAATSLDGRIATASGHSQWITGTAARAEGHRLRARCDAILIGSGTALADDPSLGCRLPGLEQASPVRVVLDGRLRLSPESTLARTARQTPTWVFTLANADAARRRALQDCGVELMEAPPEKTSGHLDVTAVAAQLAARGITRVLVEGGGEVAAAFLKADLIDQMVWLRAPLVIGGTGLPAVASLTAETLDAVPRFVRNGRGIDSGLSTRDHDTLETFLRRH